MDFRAVGTADIGSVVGFQPSHRAIHQKAIDAAAVFIQVFAGGVSVHGIEKGPCSVASCHRRSFGRDQWSDCGRVNSSGRRHSLSHLNANMPRLAMRSNAGIEHDPTPSVATLHMIEIRFYSPRIAAGLLPEI